MNEIEKIFTSKQIDVGVMHEEVTPARTELIF